MKKLILLIAAVAMMLPSCKKINEELDALGNRIDKLEQEAIPSIDEQIAAINTTLSNLDAMDKELKGYINNLTSTASNLQEQINSVNTKIGEVNAELKGDIASTNSELKGEIATAKADVLAQLEALESELKTELAQINATIATLQAKDTELEGKIAELKTYVDTELGKTTDWVNATFATLEQYNALVSEVATIKEQIKAINESITNLETKLTTKINEDIATAVSTLSADIQQKVSEITTAYTNAVKTAKEEITTAYTVAIQTAISNLDSSLKAWVGEQLANYYTIAQIDAKLAALSAEFEGKLSTQKIYLESLISSLSQTLTNKIASNGELIEGLRNSLTSLSAEVAKNAEAIADNAEKIAANATLISKNAQDIVANGNNIEANQEAITANAALIAENKQLIAEVDAKINGTSSAANTQAIADNAKAIANNAELIAQNSLAINNNAAAIAQNAADIAQLQQNLATTKTEITEAYQKAIEEVVNETNGLINSKFDTVNNRIDSEVATINNTINALTARVTTLENEVAAIKQQIAKILSDIADMKEDIANLLARIQSVSYVPKYSDGNATMDYGTKTAEFDFLISPKSAVAELAKVWNSALSVKAVYTQTRAVEFINLPITEFVADNSNGVISIKVSGTNLSNAFYTDQQDAKAMLQISDGNSSLTSEYISMTPNFNIQFEDLQVKAICCKNWDTNNDGELSYAEAAAVESIGTAFEKNANIVAFTELKYFMGISSIPNSAFIDCSSLWKIVIPQGVTNIESSAFKNCTSLTTVIFETTIIEQISGGFNESDCYGAFANCTEIRSITIPKSVQIIEPAAFLGCSKLNSVVFENGSMLKEIQGGYYDSYSYGVFTDCISLTSISIPANLEKLGAATFLGCSKLSTVEFEGESKLIEIGGGWVNGTAWCYYYPHGAFQSCTSLSHIEIPQNCKTIQYAAFYGCSNLQSVEFAEHSKLESIKGAYYKHNIKGYLGAFAYCSKLSSIVLPSNLNEIGTHAFYGCTNLSSIYCSAIIPPAIKTEGYNSGSATPYSPFEGIASGAKIYVPATSYDTYVSANYWSSYKSMIVGYNFE